MTKHSVIIVCLFGLAACLTPGEYDPIQFYDLRSDPGVTQADANTGLKVAVRPLDYARAYKQPMVVRNDGNQLVYQDLHRWAELPREMITREVVDALLDTGAFADVAYSTDISGPDLLLQGELRLFDWVRAGGADEAVAEMRMDLRNRRSDVLLWSATLSARQDMAGGDAAAFANAMSEAVAEILSTAATEIVSAAQQFERE